jgi:hypothetical protein
LLAPHAIEHICPDRGVSRALPLVLLVVAVSAVVALASPGAGLLRNPVEAAGGWRLAVRIAGAAAAAAGIAGLVRQRRHLLSKQDRHYDPAVAALVTTGAIMGVLALLALVAPAARDEDQTAVTDTAAERGSSSAVQGTAGSTSPASGMGGGFGVGVAAPRGGGASTQPGTFASADDDAGNRDWSGLQRAGTIILLIALIATVVICVRILGRRPHYVKDRLLDEPAIAAADAEAGLEASLGAVTTPGDDPRDQITAAYRRLLAALAAAGVPRAAHEAPHEHLNRALAPLGVAPGPMHRLTALYVIAQFSDQPVTGQHRAEAADALERALAGIREARAGAANGTTATVQQSYA